MSFKPNTVQVPRAIILGIQQGNFYPQDAYYAALRAMYPKKDPAEIAEKFDIKYPWKVDKFFDSETYQQNGTAPQRQQHPEAPPAPEGYLEWVQELVSQYGSFDRDVQPNVANAIYETSGGNEELVSKAVDLMGDYHNNGQEVKSPGAVVLSTLKKRSPSQIEDDWQKIQSGGTAVGNRDTRMTRAMERTEEYVKAEGVSPVRDAKFFEEDNE